MNEDEKNKYREETLKSYNVNTLEFAEKFDKLAHVQKESEFLIFEDLLKGDSILDLGCGSGEHSINFKLKGYNVTPIDFSTNMIDVCFEKGLNAKLMDIENLTFEDNTFDGIWAVTSLLHIPKSNILKVIGKLHQILNNKGVLYVCLKSGEGEKFIYDLTLNETKRFFAFWQKEEFLEITKDFFQLVEYRESNFEENKFLEFYFKKKIDVSELFD